MMCLHSCVSLAAWRTQRASPGGLPAHEGVAACLGLDICVGVLLLVCDPTQ